MYTELVRLHAELAERAERAEDTRIAWKHEQEAGEGTSSPENIAAYSRCVAWTARCRAREAYARGRLIRYQIGR